MIPLLLARWNHFWASLATESATQIHEDARTELERAQAVREDCERKLAAAENALELAREHRSSGQVRRTFGMPR